MEHNKYNVYNISPWKAEYSGTTLIAAESAEDANRMIDEFKESDPNNNNDSRGYGHIDEEDKIEHLYSDQKGFITHGIYYSG